MRQMLRTAAGSLCRLLLLCSAVFCLSSDVSAVVAGSAGNPYEPGGSSMPVPVNGRGLSLDGLDGPVQQAGAVMEDLLANIAKLSPGSGTAGRIGGDCWGDNLASATNQLLMMQQAEAASQQLSRVMAEAAAAMTAKMHGSGTAQDVMLRALLKDAEASLRDLSASVIGAIAARDQDPARTDGDCADAAAALDKTHGARLDASLQELFEEALALSGGRDASVSSWAEADALKVAALVTGRSMAGQPVFTADWLTPASRVIPGAALDRTVLMLAALSNPHPAPAVPKLQQGTVAGRRAAAEIKLKSASVSAAQAALADVAAAYAPSGYRNAVPDLEERSGLEGSGRAKPDPESGNYSRMQYLEARAGYFNSLSMTDSVNRMIAADVQRNIYQIAAENFSLNVARYRAELHRNAVLSAMLGIMTEGQNRRAADFLSQTREK